MPAPSHAAEPSPAPVLLGHAGACLSKPAGQASPRASPPGRQASCKSPASSPSREAIQSFDQCCRIGEYFDGYEAASMHGGTGEEGSALGAKALAAVWSLDQCCKTEECFEGDRAAEVARQGLPRGSAIDHSAGSESSQSELLPGSVHASPFPLFRQSTQEAILSYSLCYARGEYFDGVPEPRRSGRSSLGTAAIHEETERECAPQSQQFGRHKSASCPPTAGRREGAGAGPGDRGSDPPEPISIAAEASQNDPPVIGARLSRAPIRKSTSLPLADGQGNGCSTGSAWGISKDMPWHPARR